jgi:hypothetical protein
MQFGQQQAHIATDLGGREARGLDFGALRGHEYSNDKNNR